MEVPEASPPSARRGRFGARTDTITTTVKWLVASAGAAAAAIVAGLQLTAVADLTPSAALIATASAGLALAVVGSVLLKAGNFLAMAHPTATEISNQEIAAGILEAIPVPVDHVKYPLAAWIQERRSSLIDDANSLTAFYVDNVVGAARALAALKKGDNTGWGGRDLNPNAAGDADLKYVQAALDEAALTIANVEDAAAYWQTRTAFQALMAWTRSGLPLRFVVFLVAVLTFALVPVWGRSHEEAKVTESFPVTIYVQDALKAGVPATCPQRLTGQAVGGYLDHPTVVTNPETNCASLQLEAREGELIVVPATTVPEPQPT